MRRVQNVKISQKITGAKWAKKKEERLACRMISKCGKDVAEKSKPLNLEGKYLQLHTEKNKSSNNNNNNKTDQRQQQIKKTPPKKTPNKKLATKRRKCQS